ncbi:MAG: hypothetical protein JWQ16_1804 [Novosphingobium sp.]|nr:hypothetical protein [Novosphingobium sp.]
MTLSTIFSVYLLAVAGVAAGIAALRLEKRAARLTIAGLVLWLAYATAVGATGLAGCTDMLPPGIALLAGPVVAAILLITLTRPGAVLAAHIPIAVLLGFQTFRVGVELTLNHLAGQGLAPCIMTLAGGNIEILVAATAPVAAWLVGHGPTGRKVAWAWNVIGLLSLGNVVTRAVLSAPGPLNLIHAEVPDQAILLFPFTYIPGFMAPLALALHILAFRALGATRVSA